MSATFLAPPRFSARVYDFCGSVIKRMSHSDLAMLEKAVRSECDKNADAHSFAIVNNGNEIVVRDAIFREFLRACRHSI